MTFTQSRNGVVAAGTTSGGVTTLPLPMTDASGNPVTSAKDTLLIAYLVTTAGGVPFKAVGNTSPGWEHCGTAASGVNQQAEIWCYRNNPGGITSMTWTNDGGQNCQGHMEEWSTTLKWQVVEVFPAVAKGTTGALGPVAMDQQVRSGDLAVVLTAAAFPAAPSGTWATPAAGANTAWTKARSVNTGTKNVWATYWATTTAVGAVSVAGSYSVTAGQSAWTSVLVVFKEANAVRGRVGASVYASSYSDQATINTTAAYPSTNQGSRQEFDYFVGRQMAQTAGVVYQDKPGGTAAVPADSIQHLGNPPSGSMWNNIQECWANRVQMVWSMRAARQNIFGTAAQKAAEVAACEQDLVTVKQAGITGWIACYWNEMQINGTKWFADQAHWNTYWQALWPIYAAHGIPIYSKPSEASPSLAVSWTPPAGKVSGIVTDYYFDSADGVHNATLDTSPGPGIPSLQDIADGVKNPDGSTPNPPNPPIPLGIGETGRSGGGSTPAWSQVVGWSANGTWTSSGTAKTANGIRKFFTARLAAGKQNAPILWFDSGNGGGNWIHTPGANGEDQTGIQAELAAWADNLAPTLPGSSPVISAVGLPAGAVGTPFSASFGASGGAPPYTWTLDSGSLPAGLSLSGDGFITGTPTAAGSTPFSVKVTDSNGASATSGTLTITVTAAVVTITTTTLPDGIYNTAYSQTLEAVNGTPPYTWSVTGAFDPLPPGLLLNPATGMITGTPTAPETANMQVQAEDATGAVATAVLSLTIAPPAATGTAQILVIAAGAWVLPQPEAVAAGAWQAATEWTISTDGTAWN